MNWNINIYWYNEKTLFLIKYSNKKLNFKMGAKIQGYKFLILFLSS